MFDNDAPLHGLGFEIQPKKVVSKKKKALKVVNVAENVIPVVGESGLPEIVVSNPIKKKRPGTGKKKKGTKGVSKAKVKK